MPFHLKRLRPPSLTEIGSLPGDKSISHRALMLAAVSDGTSRIDGLLEGEDVLATARALRRLGASVEKDAASYRVRGVRGARGFLAPSAPLDFGNSGTSARLMAGLLAPCPFSVETDGDASLRKRPMGRVTAPLSLMGARFESASGSGAERLPLRMTGTARLKGIRYVLPSPSAQVKSAILLAGLEAEGATEVVEPVPTRDHSERMLRAFGADIEEGSDAQGRRLVRIRPGLLRPTDVQVPADPSSAAFLAALCLLEGKAPILLSNVCVNPHRIGFFRVLERMGALISYENRRVRSSEEVADVAVRPSSLVGTETTEAEAPSLIDEFLVLAVTAATASGRSVFRGLAELRVKESDRFDAILRGLAACGASCAADGDAIVIDGSAGRALEGGATIETRLDHRIAMSFLLLGLSCKNPVRVDAVDAVATSFPNFFEILERLGVALVEEGA
jgi:3-phosphoshikimate 1-carboxyvinyltransferase